MKFSRALRISIKIFLASLVLWIIFFPFLGFILEVIIKGQFQSFEQLLLIVVSIAVSFQIVTGALAVYFIVGAAVEEVRRPRVLSKPHLVSSSENLKWCPECQKNVDWEGWDGLMDIAKSEAMKAGFTFDITLVCKVCGYKKIVRLPKDIPAILKAEKRASTHDSSYEYG
jgi:hypothetical protein